MIENQTSNVLLDLARQVIRRAVQRIPTETPAAEAADLLSHLTHAGIFVTITVRGELRGCLGDLDSGHTVQEALLRAARGAATNDHRFRPLRPDELDEMALEITVLEPMQRIHGEEDVHVGVHGLFIEFGGRRGILLPQVARDRKWTAGRFLEAVCEKACLPTDAWKWADADLRRFEARIHSAHPAVTH
jgi:AmmeMemoRadiSam system protein A